MSENNRNDYCRLLIEQRGKLDRDEVVTRLSQWVSHVEQDCPCYHDYFCVMHFRFSRYDHTLSLFISFVAGTDCSSTVNLQASTSKQYISSPNFPQKYAL
jgi:hypothetical protein